MDLRAHAKSVIESSACATHHQHPQLIITDQQIEILCCCQAFKVVCLKNIVQLLLDCKSTLSVAWKREDLGSAAGSVTPSVTQ